MTMLRLVLQGNWATAIEAGSRFGYKLVCAQPIAAGSMLGRGGRGHGMRGGARLGGLTTSTGVGQPGWGEHATATTAQDTGP